MTQHSKAWRDAVVTHGMALSSEFRIWNKMKQRCMNPNNDRYSSYGGRGITVCERWLESFENFYSDMGPRPDGKQLDRIDNDGPYSPENCRWATRIQQQNNMRTNRRLVINGESKTVAEIARLTGLPESRIRSRVQRGWSLDRVLTPGLGKATATHCRNGHEYTSENTETVTRNGRETRCCIACRRSTGREHMRKRRAKSQVTPARRARREGGR